MPNASSLFQKLLPSKLIQCGEISAFDSYNATVAVPAVDAVASGSGKTVKVALAGHTVAVGDRVFIKGGEVIGPAPALPVYEVTV